MNFDLIGQVNGQKVLKFDPIQFLCLHLNAANDNCRKVQLHKSQITNSGG